MRARHTRLAAGLLTVAGLTGCTSLTGPSPVDANWRVHDSAHFSIHVRPGSFAEQHLETFAAVLEDQYAFSLARLDAAFDGRIAAFFHDTPSGGGFTSAREGVAFPLSNAFTIVAMPPLDANLFALMNHEANHVIARYAIGRPGTSFANEGMASALLSERHLDVGPSYLHRWVGARIVSIPPVADLADDERWSRVDHGIKYNAAASFLAHLLDTDGPAKLKQLYVCGSGEFASRFAAIYGRPLDEADAAWREHTRALAR